MICPRCSLAITPPEATVRLTHDLVLLPEPFPALPVPFLMHGDCARAHQREREQRFVAVERSPTGYPLRFAVRA